MEGGIIIDLLQKQACDGENTTIFDGRLVSLIQASHEILRDSALVQNQKDKEVILNSVYTPRTTGAAL